MPMLRLAAVPVLLAGPAHAQVHAVAPGGPDAGYEAPLLGLAAGAGRLAVRPGAELVFPSAFADDIGGPPVVRVALDVLARLNPAGVPNTPYVIVGVAAERERRETFGPAERAAALDTSTDRIGVGVRAGAGPRIGPLVGEATLGAGGVGRVVVGLRF